MWRAVGLFRNGPDLDRAVFLLEQAYREERTQPSGVARDADSWRRFHSITVARLIARAALRRRESRGGHFRADFPERDDVGWKVHLVDTRDPVE
jgi:L-aspartate oxidase